MTPRNLILLTEEKAPEPGLCSRESVYWGEGCSLPTGHDGSCVIARRKFETSIKVDSVTRALMVVEHPRFTTGAAA